MIRLGLLSTAGINDAVLEGARGLERIEVVAVASRDRSRAEAYAREHGLARAHAGYEELLADPDVDAVYLPLPNSLHVPWSIRALEAGKHVLCEKPLARRAADAEWAFVTAERAGLVLLEAFMYRHHPQTRRLAELVREGAVGRLRLVRAAFTFPLQGEDNIRLAPELDGGAFLDVGCYCVSAIRLLAGEPESVWGEQQLGATGVDEVFVGTLAFPGGVTAVFDCGMRTPHRAELEAVGEEGVIRSGDPWLFRRPGLELVRGEQLERIEVEPASSYRLELENFAAAIAGRAEPLLGREESVAQARVLEALLRSAEERMPVRV